MAVLLLSPSSPRSRLACISSHLPSLFFLLLSISQCCSFVPISQPQSRATTATATATFVLAASANGNNRLAYIIDPIGEDRKEQLFAEIADMCTDVFYKEGQMHAKPEDALPPWKQSQITKLRKSSTADLKGRRQRYPETNDMFLAYHVVEAEEGSASSFNINDLDRVYNFPADGKGDADYVRGDLLGFVEITQRSYNLGPDDETDERPFLTNLAVSNKARQSGIGSQLMEACERHVVDVWNMKDVALEVDYDNSNALAFYSKRGYQHIFSSSACQRYDASGLFLRKVQCTKEIMLKTLIV